MQMLLSLLPWAAALFISGVFLDSLRFKFAGHPTTRHIFETLRDWSKIELFYPVGPWAIGLGELLSSLLLIAVPLALAVLAGGAFVGAAQFLGGLIAIAIMSGAIAFHLFTPLGIKTPVQWSGNVIVRTSPALFYTACITWICALFLLVVRWPAFASLFS
ncbi:MAG: hypothetical protein HXY21_11175 [Parvularculaceae bacterium]|nr:hypothetical protein [Parvularculaceae bacterium]